MRRICIIGSGHVGLVTGACLAEIGNQVVCVDVDHLKLERLRTGIFPFYEPGLEQLLQRQAASGRLAFSHCIREAILDSEVLFICVGTPQGLDGEVDLSHIQNAVSLISSCLNGLKIIVEKSTVPVKAGAWIEHTLRLRAGTDVQFAVVSNPEFSREGSAIYDFMHPDRIVIGTNDAVAKEVMSEIYSPLKAPLIVTNLETAELIKHASNGFLALKISYANSIAAICEKVGADIVKVAEGMGYDQRIGRAYLDAGSGYGGACLPKDVAALIKTAEDAGFDFEILKAAQSVNRFQSRLIVGKVKRLLSSLDNKTIGILGLSYKPGTDDMHEAPSVAIVRLLQEQGAHIKAYDPRAMENARGLLEHVELSHDVYEVARNSDALILVTEWDEFKRLDFSRLKSLLRTPAIVDGRNLFDPRLLQELGFLYEGIGR